MVAVREQDKTEKFEFSWVIWKRCSWTGTRKIVYLLEKDPSTSLVVEGFSRNNEPFICFARIQYFSTINMYILTSFANHRFSIDCRKVQQDLLVKMDASIQRFACAHVIVLQLIHQTSPYLCKPFNTIISDVQYSTSLSIVEG